MKPAERLRIAWFSPLHTRGQKTSSVSAYASDELLPLLRERFDLNLFHSGFDSYQDFPTYHYLSAFVRHREQPYDFFFYQLEDQKASNFIRVHLGLMPGMVWFHDFIFSSFGPEPILNSPWREVAKKFSEDSAPWPVRGEELSQNGPLGFREAAWAVMPIFSNPVALSEYRRNITSKVWSASTEATAGAYVPLPAANRRREVSGAKVLRMGFCGSPRIEHRAHKVLQALREFGSGCELCWLLEDHEVPQAKELLKEFEILNCALEPGRTPERWRQMTAQLDVALHPWFSVYGQPDPYLSISLMAGLPSVVTRFGAAEYLPENLVFKIEPGEHEVFQFTEVLRAIQGHRTPNVQERAHEFAVNHFGSEVVAQELSRVFQSRAGELREFQSKWEAFERQAAASVVAEAKSYVSEGAAREKLLAPVFEELGWGRA